MEAFKNKAECFVKQYAEFSVPGPDDKPLHVNGRLTLGENIADAGGLSASFQAWQRRAAKTPNKNLPGLEHFTQQQMFFVTYSNWWCGKSRKDTAINRVYTDPHAPKWARILGETTCALNGDFQTLTGLQVPWRTAESSERAFNVRRRSPHVSCGKDAVEMNVLER